MQMDANAVNTESSLPAILRHRLAPNRDSAGTARYRITNGFPIGSLDMFIQMVLGRV